VEIVQAARRAFSLIMPLAALNIHTVHSVPPVLYGVSFGYNTRCTFESRILILFHCLPDPLIPDTITQIWSSNGVVF
jgi:hypothetical protein